MSACYLEGSVTSNCSLKRVVLILVVAKEQTRGWLYSLEEPGQFFTTTVYTSASDSEWRIIDYHLRPEFTNKYGKALLYISVLIRLCVCVQMCVCVCVQMCVCVCICVCLCVCSNVCVCNGTNPLITPLRAIKCLAKGNT